MVCAPGRIRTCNLLIRSQVLYPLSYGRIVPIGESTGRPRRALLPVPQMISSLVQVTPSADGPDDDLAASWDLIRDGVAATQRRILAEIEKDGLPGQWFEVLRLLLGTSEHRMAMSALARDLAMTAGGFTKLADRMAREGLIDRRNSSGDRRIVYATLTPKGLRQAKSSAALYQAGLREHVLGVLSPSRLTELTAAVRLLRDAPASRRRGDETPDPGIVATERDPALPDRRRRGRPSQ